MFNNYLKLFSFNFNFLYFFSEKIFIQILNFIIIFLITKNFSAEVFGHYSVAQNIFLILYSLSFHNSYVYLRKKISNNITSKSLNKEILSVFIIRFCTSIFLYLALFLILITLKTDIQLKVIILILSFNVIIYTFTIFYDFLFVKKYFKKLLICQVLVSTFSFFLKILIIIYYKNIYLVCAISIFECLIYALVIIQLFYFKKKFSFKIKFDIKYMVIVFKKIYLLPFISFFGLLSMRVDVLMISNYLSATEAGYYAIASRLASTVMLVGQIFHLLVYTNLAKELDNQTNFNNYYKDAFIYTSVISITFCILIFLFGKFYLGLFGISFLVAHDTLKILSLNIFACLIINLWQSKQFLNDKLAVVIIFQLLALLLNIIFNYILIKNYGISGAAYATLISTVLSFLIILIVNKQEFYLLFFAFSLERIKKIANKTFKVILLK